MNRKRVNMPQSRQKEHIKDEVLEKVANLKHFSELKVEDFAPEGGISHICSIV